LHQSFIGVSFSPVLFTTDSRMGTDCFIKVLFTEGRWSHINDFLYSGLFVWVEFFQLGFFIKNRSTVKKGAALFKMASVKKVVKSKGVAKKWLCWYKLMAKILITTIQVNLCCLIPASLGISTKFTWIVVIYFLPSTYIITVISWLPSLISQLFHTGHFK